jgi:hypothetical protein
VKIDRQLLLSLNYSRVGDRDLDEERREMHREAAEHLRETVANQIDGRRRLDSKALQVVSVNVVVAGAFVTGAISFIQGQQAVGGFIVYVAAGIFALLASVWYGARVFSPQQTEYGIGPTVPEDIEGIDNLDQFYSDLLDSYVEVFNINETGQETKSSNLRGEILWSIGEVLFFFVAIVRLSIVEGKFVIYDLVAVLVLVGSLVLLDRYSETFAGS